MIECVNWRQHEIVQVINDCSYNNHHSSRYLGNSTGSALADWRYNMKTITDASRVTISHNQANKALVILIERGPKGIASFKIDEPELIIQNCPEIVYRLVIS